MGINEDTEVIPWRASITVPKAKIVYIYNQRAVN